LDLLEGFLSNVGVQIFLGNLLFLIFALLILRFMVKRIIMNMVYDVLESLREIKLPNPNEPNFVDVIITQLLKQFGFESLAPILIPLIKSFIEQNAQQKQTNVTYWQ
jgi:Na+/H+-translocating membrane pyrophosphatase